MKFSEIGEESWPELQPYLDTCLIPLSGLTGEESPWEATEKVARTGQWLAPLEQAFRGRTVTMPAFHYDSGSSLTIEWLNRLIGQWKNSGFRYVIAISGQRLEGEVRLDADLIIQPGPEEDEPDSQLISKSVASMWRGQSDEHSS
jgi:23S rRNA (pseudouridine1915-N3)-methyltransferase